jgi:hypothetical protein
MSSTPPTETSGITDIEMEQLDRANASDRTPAVFIHGLWLLPSSWDRWAALFEDAGYIALTPGWPDDPNTVEEANADPGVFANKSIGQTVAGAPSPTGRSSSSSASPDNGCVS